MADTIEKIKTANAVVRTGIIVTILSAMSYAGCVGYQQYVIPAREAIATKAQLEEVNSRFNKLRQEFDEQAIELANLETSLKLMKVDRRLANVDILETGVDDKGEPFMQVEFYEVSGDGGKIGEPRSFRLRGNELYVSSWVVQFEDKYVEGGDLLKGASLCIFKSIWGNLDTVAGGYPIENGETDTAIPDVYKNASEASQFEQKIWTDFWSVSNNPVKQQELGIRASGGYANFMQVVSGQTYQYEVRASGGPSVKPLKSLPDASSDETDHKKND